MATKYIDNLVTNTVSYAESSEDRVTNDARVIKLTDENFLTSNVASIYLGSIDNGKIVKMSAKGGADLANVYAFDVTYYINTLGAVSDLVSLESYPAPLAANVTTVIDGDYLHVIAVPGAWSSLVTII